MRIGIGCFSDIEICSIIETMKTEGHCDIMNTDDTFIYDTEEKQDTNLSEYITGILDVYTPISELPRNFPDSELDYIENILENEWSIFNIPAKDIKNVIMEICKEDYSKDSLIFKEKVGIKNLCDSGYLKRECLLGESTWEKFMSSIKNINRFHSNHFNLKLLEEVFHSERLILTIRKGEEKFYRGRISGDKPYGVNEMGAPNALQATAGRANSKGIACLYLAGDITTTLHEIRAKDLDYVSVGIFKAKENLKIVDLSNLNKISPFSDETRGCEWFAINMSILKKISVEIAKPLGRQDTELDYLPTQYITDFIKSLGYDGICYRSTLHMDGVNYAIFDEKKMKCVNVKLYHVDSLEYNIAEK